MFNTTNPYLSQSLFGSLSIPKRKVFVSYHHANDQPYYNAFSNHFSKTFDIIQDNSLDRNIDSVNTEYVMRRIREEYLTGTSCTILLCGAETQNRKYVDWEISATLDKKHALIGVKLPTAKISGEGKVIVPDRFAANYYNGYAIWVTWENLFNSGHELSYYINDAVQHSQKNVGLIDNSTPLMVRNRNVAYAY